MLLKLGTRSTDHSSEPQIKTGAHPLGGRHRKPGAIVRRSVGEPLDASSLGLLLVLPFAFPFVSSLFP